MTVLTSGSTSATVPGAEEVPCPRCGSEEIEPRGEGEDWLYHVPGRFHIAECRRCGLWHQNPRAPADQHHLLYPANYGPHDASALDIERRPLGPGMARYLRTHLGYAHLERDVGGWRSSRLFDPYRAWLVGTRLIPQYAPHGRLLDVGCGSGSALAELRRLGWSDLHGIELVPEAAQRARDAGFQVLTGPSEEMIERYPDASFDVIRSTMVLEHLVDPFRLVRRLATKLKPGGQFLFSTVDHAALDRKAYGAHWAGYDLPRHMVYFSRADLAKMLEPDFDGVEWFHQSAPVDYIRSSSWRRRPVDRAILALGERGLAAPSLALALAHRTTRVSVRCRRRAP